MALRSWPRRNVTVQRQELIDIAREHLVALEQDYIAKLAEYDLEVGRWRETIAARLVAYIPALERHAPWSPSEFWPVAREPNRARIETLEALIGVLEHLDMETIDPELRQQIATAFGFFLSYD